MSLYRTFRTFARITTPLIGFGVGFAFFPADWRRGKWQPRKLVHFNEDALHRIEQLELYKLLNSDTSLRKIYTSETFPTQHRQNHVGSGLLFGPDLFEVDPVLFIDEDKGELTAFYHLGKELVSLDGRIHNGVTATILDEGLCMCGFSKLPSKRGVTAKLSIDFNEQAPPDSTVVLRAKVVEAKGRKVVIRGSLETFDDGKPVEIATLECIMVEPRWFKYLRWLQL